jgi:Fic family protein
MINSITKNKISALFDAYRAVADDNSEALYEAALAEIPESVYNSNAIENSTLTLKDTEGILLKGAVRRDKDIREIYEAKNLAYIMTKLHDDVKKGKDSVTPKEILRQHKKLLAGIDDSIAGRFRSGKEWVRIGTHIGANPDFVNELIFELTTKYHADKEAYFLDKIAHFHAEFEAIHPFADGNGRIGRIIINGQLMQLGYPPIIIPNKGKHKDYYPLFDEYIKSGKFDGFTRFFALLLMESMHKRLTILQSKRMASVSEWAKSRGLNVRSALNMSMKQTIPAFRLRGKWMIDSAFEIQKYQIE